MPRIMRAAAVPISYGADPTGVINPDGTITVWRDRTYTRVEAARIAAMPLPKLGHASCVHDRPGFDQYGLIMLMRRALCTPVRIRSSDDHIAMIVRKGEGGSLLPTSFKYGPEWAILWQWREPELRAEIGADDDLPEPLVPFREEGVVRLYRAPDWKYGEYTIRRMFDAAFRGDWDTVAALAI